MKTLHLLLALSLTGAVLLAGCAGDDGGESTGTGDQSGRELNTDITVEGESDATDNSTTETNTTNTTSSG